MRDGTQKKELKTSMNPIERETAFNKYNADGIEYFDWKAPKTETFDTSSDCKWK